MIKKKKKILFIHHAQGWGGAPINMIKIINSLDKSKYSIEVLLITDSIVSHLLRENNISYKIAKAKFFKRFYKYYCHIVPANTRWYQPIRQFKLIISWLLSRYYYASKELKNHEFDIVHLNSSVLTDWLAPCKAKGKVVMHIQEPLSKGYFGLRHYFFTNQMRRYSDKIIAISKDNARRVGLLKKTTVIYNFTGIPDNLPECYHNSENSKTILYLGGAAKIKGFYTLVNALPYIEPDIKVIFAGNYPSKQGLKKLLPKNIKHAKAFQKMRNKPNAIEVGLVKEVSDLIRSCTVMVSPLSVEHFSRPVIEAFAHKKPVIGSNVEGMDEIIDHNVNGLIVKKNSPRELAGTINYICSNPVIAKKMGEMGYQKALELFSPKNVKQIEKIYDNL